MPTPSAVCVRAHLPTTSPPVLDLPLQHLYSSWCSSYTLKLNITVHMYIFFLVYSVNGFEPFKIFITGSVSCRFRYYTMSTKKEVLRVKPGLNLCR